MAGMKKMNDHAEPTKVERLNNKKKNLAPYLHVNLHGYRLSQVEIFKHCFYLRPADYSN